MSDTLNQRGKRQPRWRIWLHRIGYLTSVIVLAELLGVAYVVGAEQMRWRAVRQEGATRVGPLPPLDRDQWVRPPELAMLNALPSTEVLHGNGFRFAPMPALGLGSANFGIALSLAPNAPVARGVLIVQVRTKENETEPMQHRVIAMPASAYIKMMASIDPLIDDWGGETGCLDGTPTAFERVRQAEVVSGEGNCDEAILQMRKIVLGQLRRFAPGDDLPTDESWYPNT